MPRAQKGEEKTEYKSAIIKKYFNYVEKFHCNQFFF